MIDLYSVATANGQKAHIMLEETGLPYNAHPINLPAGEHLTDAFLARNPFGRVPVLVDQEGPGGEPFTVCECSAILLYLAEKCGQFMPEDPRLRIEVHQWLSFVSANIGPAFSGQFWFSVIAAEKIPFAIDRFISESRRGLKAMDRYLEGRDYLVGDSYTIADIHAYPVAATSAARLEGGLDPYPHLRRWSSAIGERPAVTRGMAVLT